jgi:hypothetical protein
MFGNINAKNFIVQKRIQLLWNSKKMPKTEVFFLSGENENLSPIFDEIQKQLKSIL